MKKLLFVLLSSVMLISMSACKKKVEEPVSETTSVVEEKVYTSPLFQMEVMESSYIHYGQMLATDWQPEGLVGFATTNATPIARTGAFYNNDTLGLYYDVKMDTIREQLGEMINLVGVFQDVVIVREGDYNQPVDDMTWETLSINGGKVLKISGDNTFDFYATAEEAYVSIGATTPIASEGGGAIYGSSVHTLKITSGSDMQVQDLGEAFLLPPRGYAIRPIAQVLPVANKIYVITQEKIFEIKDNQLHDTGINFSTNNRSIVSYFITQHNKIYAIETRDDKTILNEWSSDWTHQAEYELQSEAAPQSHIEAFNRYEVNSIDENTISFIHSYTQTDGPTEIFGYVFSTKDNKEVEKLYYTLEDTVTC